MYYLLGIYIRARRGINGEALVRGRPKTRPAPLRKMLFFNITFPAAVLFHRFTARDMRFSLTARLPESAAHALQNI